jgi:hypothetical protein
MSENSAETSVQRSTGRVSGVMIAQLQIKGVGKVETATPRDLLAWSLLFQDV